MRTDRQFMTLLGRCLLAAIFLLSGVIKLADPQGTQAYMAGMGMAWATAFFFWSAVAVELVGGLSLLLGLWTRVGSGMLFLFMIPTTGIFHTEFADPNQIVHLLKNLAIMGGLLYLEVFGPGPISFDSAWTRQIQEEEGQTQVDMARRRSA